MQLDRLRHLTLTQREPVTEHLHLAFLAWTRAEVDAFHRAGVEVGYRSNGAQASEAMPPITTPLTSSASHSHNVEAVYREPATHSSWAWLRSGS